MNFAEKGLNQGAKKKVPELSTLNENTFLRRNAASGLLLQNLFGRSKDERKKTEFIQVLSHECRQRPRTIALPESTDERVLKACSQLLHKGIAAKIALFGSKDEILKIAREQQIELEPFSSSIIWCHEQIDQLIAQTEAHYTNYLQRKNKPTNLDQIKTWGHSHINQAAYLVGRGQIDSGLAGCVATTADVIRAAMVHIGMTDGQQTISGAFAMIREQGSLPHANYLYADCGVVIDPSVEQLVDIAASTVETFQQLFPQEVPKVAFLSFSTKGSANHPKQAKIAEAAALFRSQYPDVACDGELQFDAAISPSVGQRKSPGSPVAGYANCFIFPDLNAGNIAYKMTQRLGFFDAYGPILQGTAKPFSDLSRGATAEDIEVAAMITMLRAKIR